MAAQESERGAVMGKLVRDRIPEIIKSDGKTPIIEILSNEEYLVLCQDLVQNKMRGFAS